MDKIEFNLRLIKNFVNKIISPVFLHEENNVYVYTLDGNVITIDYNCNSMYIQKNGNDIFLTFDMLQKIHGIKCVSGYVEQDTVTIERYEHGIPHGEWSEDSKTIHTIKNYNHGVLEGFFKISSRTSKITGHYKNNVYNGDVEYFIFKNGLYVPEKTETYDNGVLKNIVSHITPEPSGISIPIKTSKLYVIKKRY